MCSVSRRLIHLASDPARTAAQPRPAPGQLLIKELHQNLYIYRCSFPNHPLLNLVTTKYYLFILKPILLETMDLPTTTTQGQKHVLVIGLTKFLSGHPIKTVIDQNRAAHAQDSKPFDIIGFDVVNDDPAQDLQKLKETLEKGPYDGILVAWCSRGYPARTALFERLMNLVVAHKGEAKLIFNTGPQDIIPPLVRNFS